MMGALPSPRLEFPFTDADFSALARLVDEDAGIDLPDTKKTLVYSRLAKRLRALGLASFSDYCALVRTPQGEEERRRMLLALTTNVTRFHREGHHYRHLREEVLPGLIARATAGDRIRLWSAACSTGEEAYGIAMELLDASRSIASFDVKLLATDIDDNVLQTARKGIYGRQAAGNLPGTMGERFLHADPADPGMVRVRDEVRALVSFKQLNLAKPWPVSGPFDVIFCRNVAIYFSAETQRRLWSGFAKVTRPGATLYIGHSEKVHGAAEPCFETVGVTTYRRSAIALTDHAT